MRWRLTGVDGNGTSRRSANLPLSVDIQIKTRGDVIELYEAWDLAVVLCLVTAMSVKSRNSLKEKEEKECVVLLL